MCQVQGEGGECEGGHLPRLPGPPQADQAQYCHERGPGDKANVQGSALVFLHVFSVKLSVVTNLSYFLVCTDVITYKNGNRSMIFSIENNTREDFFCISKQLF